LARCADVRIPRILKERCRGFASRTRRRSARSRTKYENAPFSSALRRSGHDVGAGSRALPRGGDTSLALAIAAVSGTLRASVLPRLQQRAHVRAGATAKRRKAGFVAVVRDITSSCQIVLFC
jgi:hypothetical protein